MSSKGAPSGDGVDDPCLSPTSSEERLQVLKDDSGFDSNDDADYLPMRSIAKSNRRPKRKTMSGGPMSAELVDDPKEKRIASELAIIAIEEHNKKIIHLGRKYVFKEILSVKQTLAGGWWFHMIFEAKELKLGKFGKGKLAKGERVRTIRASVFKAIGSIPPNVFKFKVQGENENKKAASEAESEGLGNYCKCRRGKPPPVRTILRHRLIWRFLLKEKNENSVRVKRQHCF